MLAKSEKDMQHFSADREKHQEQVIKTADEQKEKLENVKKEA